jgi:hypothetical protein
LLRLTVSPFSRPDSQVLALSFAGAGGGCSRFTSAEAGACAGAFDFADEGIPERRCLTKSCRWILHRPLFRNFLTTLGTFLVGTGAGSGPAGAEQLGQKVG